MKKKTHTHFRNTRLESNNFSFFLWSEVKWSGRGAEKQKLSVYIFCFIYFFFWFSSIQFNSIQFNSIQRSAVNSVALFSLIDDIVDSLDKNENVQIRRKE